MSNEFLLNEIPHKYGPRIHILNDPFATTLLCELCSPKTIQPRVNQLVHLLYGSLLRKVVNRELNLIEVEVPTRMTELHPNKMYRGKVFSPEQRIITVSLARAGQLPSQVCYDMLNQLVNPQNVRQDHVHISRTTDQDHQVTGSHIAGAKIGGDKEQSLVIFPDPMGATGSTIKTIIDYYQTKIAGAATRFLALHLIVTPEYLKQALAVAPNLDIYAFRVDRGLSSDKVLNSVPGTFWNEERGLNDNQYIVPGGGGFGEIMNNSFV
ncbi:MAG: uracil phosphoribosyltransferase [Pseudomonadota bacterium]|nr:uracil phosphoribosyltransferase [Pseudomonadota bacterium]